MTSEIIDQASALEEMMRDHAIQSHRLNHSAVSATHCEECGDKLLDARRKAYPGCTMCVDCLVFAIPNEKEERNGEVVIPDNFKKITYGQFYDIVNQQHE